MQGVGCGVRGVGCVGWGSRFRGLGVGCGGCGVQDFGIRVGVSGDAPVAEKFTWPTVVGRTSNKYASQGQIMALI